MQNTLKAKFKALSVPSAYQAQFLQDTFGGTSDGEYVPGLVDCRAIEEFQCRLDALEENGVKLVSRVKRPIVGL